MSKYGSYRGRRTLSPKGLLIIILLLLLLYGVGHFLLEPYLVYTDGGLKIDFSQSISNVPAPTPTPQVEIPIVTPEPEPSPEPSVAPATNNTLLSSPISYLLDGSLPQLLAQSEANGALLLARDMDGDNGYLYQLEVGDALDEVEGYMVAYLSCFRDNEAPYTNNAMALRTSTGNWWDSESNRWLSPDSQEVYQYLSNLCVIAAQQGYQELLLDYAAFPTSDMGDTDTLLETERYPLEERTSQLEAFYQVLTQALAPYPEVTLSVVLSPDVLVDGGIQSGQTLSLVGKYFQHIWVDFPQEDLPLYEAQLLEAGIEDPLTQLVFLSEGTLPTDGRYTFTS